MSFFEELRPYLHQFVVNRHKVIHGVVENSITLSVAFFDKRSKETVTERVNIQEVQTMIDHADSIARGLKRFGSEMAALGTS